MNTPVYAYHPEMPSHCIPDEAEPVGHIYKAVEITPANEGDFLSDVESGKCTRKPQCKNWGCSVWRDEEAVSHARAVYDHFREWFIVEADLSPTDGQIASTPSRKQPKHCTFWKVHGRGVAAKFKTFMEPEIIEGKDPLSAEVV